MLTSITPLGERGRGNRYGLTVAAYLVGSTAGGAALGVLLGGAGALLLGHLPVSARLLVAGAVCLLAVGFDLAPGRRLTGWHRQVNEDWLTTYRGWVYGAGFGLQLGAAVLTIVTSAVTWAFLAVVALVASPLAGLACGALFGLVRALPVLALRRVHAPGELQQAAARLDRRAAPAARATVWAAAAVATALVVTALAAGPSAGAGGAAA